jgi:hypothetical protein
MPNCQICLDIGSSSSNSEAQLTYDGLDRSVKFSGCQGCLLLRDSLGILGLVGDMSEDDPFSSASGWEPIVEQTFCLRCGLEEIEFYTMHGEL